MAASNSGKEKNVVVEECNFNIDDYKETGKGEDNNIDQAAKNEFEKVRELVQFKDEAQLDFMLDVGLVKDYKEIPVTEAPKHQIEGQKRLEEQLEVQKKLQMRIQAQGKYLQAVLEKAQRNLSLDESDGL